MYPTEREMDCKDCPYRITIVDDGQILYECSVRECPYEAGLGEDEETQAFRLR